MQKYTFSSEIIRKCMIFSRKLNLSLANGLFYILFFCPCPAPVPLYLRRHWCQIGQIRRVGKKVGRARYPYGCPDIIEKVSCRLVAKVFGRLSVSLSYKSDMGGWLYLRIFGRKHLGKHESYTQMTLPL